MNRITIQSKVGSDGVLHFTLPVGSESANQDVRVTIEPLTPVQMTQEEWRQRVYETAGKWQCEFERPEQLELEEREPLS